MTPAQLDHLRRIDAHLVNLLSTAEKRTPGEWKAATETVWTRHERICGDAETDDCAFIAACAGNAEAGWAYLRNQIKKWLSTFEFARTREFKNVAEQELETILAAFPNV